MPQQPSNQPPKIILTDADPRLPEPALTDLSGNTLQPPGVGGDIPIPSIRRRIRLFFYNTVDIVLTTIENSLTEFLGLCAAAVSIYGLHWFLSRLFVYEHSSLEFRIVEYAFISVEVSLLFAFLWRIVERKEHHD